MKVSVIIPTYNRYRYLLNAIKSVREQTHEDVEIIVVNDGSTQGEYCQKELIEKIGEKGFIIHCSSNSSLTVGTEGRSAFTRNIGIRVATGDYVAFLDDDDYWLPKKLETQLKMMKENNCEMSTTEALAGKGIYDSKQKYKLYLEEINRNFYKSIGIKNFDLVWDEKFLKKHNSCITSSVILSKRVVDNIGFMPYKRVGEDYAYWLKAIQHTNCVFCEIPLIYYDLSHGDGSLY